MLCVPPGIRPLSVYIHHGGDQLGPLRSYPRPNEKKRRCPAGQDHDLLRLDPQCLVLYTTVAAATAAAAAAVVVAVVVVVVVVVGGGGGGGGVVVVMAVVVFFVVVVVSAVLAVAVEILLGCVMRRSLRSF
ncbi:hypothetical protein ElyMa_005543700 [Elysia marginata]|uniref:Uncharacterized protein n=1 Tax=Elysia marginata TaxID=1093978 RepID=A0AAV4EY06_9GAST|nr:hypothetical protein ElyMa_005543700 [Elysia marginata]